MQTIIPNLWFDTQAEDAAAFYIAAFGDGRVHTTTRYTDAGKEIHGQEPGSVLTVEFELHGATFIGLNGGPAFTFTPAISFMVRCTSPSDVEELWGKLIEGGEALMQLDTYPFAERYGWVKDKYGVTWQLIAAEDQTKRAIVPSLMFVGDVAGKAEEAMQHYVGIFPDSRVGDITRYGNENPPDREGTVMYADFTLRGQAFAAMDSAHEHNFTFNEAVSLMVLCEDQAEIDRLSDALSTVPEAEQCGWLKDKYGVSWQITPTGMEEMLNSPDRDKANRAMEAMLKMKRINIAALKEAFEG